MLTCRVKIEVKSEVANYGQQGVRVGDGSDNSISAFVHFEGLLRNYRSYFFSCKIETAGQLLIMDLRIPESVSASIPSSSQLVVISKCYQVLCNLILCPYNQYYILVG